MDNLIILSVIKYLVVTSKKIKILQMKISSLFSIKRIKPLALSTLALLSLTYNIHAADAEAGKKTFNAMCAACHKPDSRLVGPALKDARQRWIDNSSEENFYKWIQNSQAVIDAGDAYAKEMEGFDPSVMPPQAVTKEQIDNIFEYVDSYTPPPPPTGGPTEGPSVAEEKETSSWFWWLIAILLLIVIGAVGGVRSQLANLDRKQRGEEVIEHETLAQSARRWAWNNRGWFGVTVFIGVIALLSAGMVDLMQIGVFEDYKPEQPIAYSHKLHAGDLGIDCKYCHNSVTKSRHAGIPTVNVCMNCHKAVDVGTTTGTEEIAKIYDAAGFDIDTRSYTGETKPIKWVKVHNLPDHVYFNHSQHVVVGGLDCAQCHGDMTKETVARVMTTKDLNAVEANKIKFTRPTLTMGWCVECHKESSVDIAGSHVEGADENEDTYYGVIHTRLLKDQETYRKYLEDDKISVADLGGLECAKCHY